MPIKVLPLNSNSEQAFWNFVNQDVPHYYFFILDWKLYRDSTRIFLALKQDKIDGMMLIYRESIVQLRGSREAAKALLKHLDLEKADIQALKEHENVLLEKYKPLKKYEMILMNLRKGDEKLHIKYPVRKLASLDAEDISNLMREAYPEWWGETAPDQIAEGMNDVLWLGIKKDERLISTGNTRLTDFSSNIGVVATHQSYRNRGYATSVVSALVKEILQKAGFALIHVLRDNLPAVHVYKKVGFRPCRSYFFIKAERRHYA